jgi:hypothetical protein
MNTDDDDIAANAEKTSFSPGARLLQIIKRRTKYCAGIVVTNVSFAVTVWQFNINFVKNPVSPLTAMRPVMAFAFISLKENSITPE